MIPPDAVFRILAKCAGIPGHARVTSQLQREFDGFTDWEMLLAQAESHGLDALLRAHLLEARVDVAADVSARLTARWIRLAHAHAVRTRVIAGVLAAAESERIPLLVLKGAALAHLVYDDPRLRPMRDVDALVRPSDLRRAVRLLEACGFAAAGPPVPDGHHHARAMSTIVEEAMVTIELHHNLLQPAAFLSRLEFRDVIDQAQPFQWADRTALTLGRERMLWHVYAHAFGINVTRPAIRLISVADLVALTERWIDEIDWEQVRRSYGRAWRALPHLHDLTPWSPRVLERFGAHEARRQRSVRPIASRLEWSVSACRDVFWPRDWWLCTRYGIEGWPRRVWSRAVAHPLALVHSLVHSAKQRLSSRSA